MITKEELLPLKDELFEARDVFLKKERALTVKLMKYLKQEGISDIYPVVGDWKCEKSPIGHCIYNHFDDPVHDDCIFCHEPDERK